MEFNHAHNDITARLYEASINGDVDTLNELIREDQLLLIRITSTFFQENPLHIAALHGHSDYSRALLSHNPLLAGEVDAWGHTALHLAAAKGHVEAVKVLVGADCSVCLRRSSDGKLPLHLAVMKRHVKVVRELVRAHPGAAREVSDRGETVLHLCVRCNHLEALRVIAEEIDDDEFFGSVDEDGNTILHFAALLKHLKIVEYIIPKAGRMANALNQSGLTALDMAENSFPRDLEGLEVASFLIKAGIPRAKDHMLPSNNNKQLGKSKQNSWSRIRSFFNQDDNWIENMRGSLMVVATLTTSMAFQAALQPPGGVWADSGHGHVAGSAVAATREFFRYNILTFLSSTTVILILVSGSPLNNNKFGVWLLTLFIWATLSFTTLSYSATLSVVIPPEWYNGAVKIDNGQVQRGKFSYGITYFLDVLLLAGVIIMLYHSFFALVWLARMLQKVIACVREKPTSQRVVPAIV